MEVAALLAAKPTIKLAARCGSLRKGSFNRGLLKSAPLKNAIDWASRPPNAWADKAAAIVSAGGGFGGGRSQYHLHQIGAYLDLRFINKPEFFLNAFQPPAKFEEAGNLIDEAAEEKIKQVLLSLQAFTLWLKGIC